MKTIYMQAHDKMHFDYANKYLQERGYVWVGLNKNPTFEEAKKWFHGNSKMYLKGFYNNITGKLDIQATTKTIEATYGFRL